MLVRRKAEPWDSGEQRFIKLGDLGQPARCKIEELNSLLRRRSLGGEVNAFVGWRPIM